MKLYVGSKPKIYFGYDALDRLTAAKGACGSFGWTYDANGNRLTEMHGSSTAVYVYAAHSDRLATINGGPLAGSATPSGFLQVVVSEAPLHSVLNSQLFARGRFKYSTKTSRY